MRKPKRITDKTRLDWLSRHKWQIYSADCFQAYHADSAYANMSLRAVIDSTIRQSRIAGRKK